MIAILAFAISLAISYAGTRLLLRRPPPRGFVDVPNERSSHATPKLRLGGIAIVGAFFAAYGAALLIDPALRAFLPMAAGCAILFTAGLLDDWRGLGVGVKLGAQVAAALIAIAAGNVLHGVTLPVVGYVGFGWFAYPLTAIVIIASINFYNFIDGIDGLAAGGGFIAGAFLAMVAALVGQPAIAVMALITAGAALGFLQFNFPPSRLFMGDSGSTFFGYCFAYLAVAGNGGSPGLPFFVSMLLVSSLYLDATLTIVNRLARGERVLQPHRTHYYQRLLQLGLNHKQVTLLEYLVMIMLGASALLYVRAGSWFGPFVGAAWVVAFVLAILKIRAWERGGRLFWERRALFVVATDFAAIVAAYLGAYFLRMNFEFTPAEGKAVLRALPIVVMVRSACFFKFGLYRSLWRYTSVADVIRVIKAVTAGSAIILAVVVLLYRFVAFPRTLFLIEYFLLISLVLGARFSTRLFHEIGREAHGEDIRRYGVVGAGDHGERVAREINARGARETVVCYIDDDLRRRGLLLGGVPIEGPGAELAEICRRRRLDALVFALQGAGEDTAMVWAEWARAAGVPLEGAPGSTLAREPRALVLERVAAALGRAPASPSPRVATALRGRRVLLTHGGGRAGASMVAGLRVAGAVPIVHRLSPDAESSTQDAARVFGSLFDGVAGAWDELSPDIVIHAVSAVAPGGENDDEFLWAHLVRETDAVARSIRGRPGRGLVILCEWGAAQPADRSVAAAAVMEAVVLNRSGLESVAVVRVPRILTSERILDERGPGGYADVLEGEAARLVLEVAAGGFRGIYAALSGPEIDVAVARRAAAGGEIPPARRSARPAPVFPSEHLDECGIAGARRVLSPLFPAADPFRRVVISGAIGATGEQRDEWVRAVAAQLDPAAGALRR